LGEECLSEGVKIRAREEGGASDKRAEEAVQAAGGGGQQWDGIEKGEQRCVEKLMTGFRIDDRTIKRGKLVCISVI
jgi:hypothetical protein